MKLKTKLLIFFGIFSFMIIPKNVNALTYNKNGETITVNDNNLIYYLYSAYSSYFNDYDYFYLIRRTSDNINWIYFTMTQPTRNSNGNYSRPNPSVFIQFKKNGFDYNTFSVNENAGSSSNQQVYNSSFTPLFSNFNIIKNDSTATFNANITKQELYDYFNTVQKYTITYYLNNEMYQTYEVEKGSSHTLIDYTYDSTTKNFSGWQYDSNIDLTNITQNVEICGTLSDKPIYTITYYLDNKKYREDSVIEGNSYSIISNPDFNKYTYSFSGWQYDSNIDLTNITQNVEITGTLTELTKTPVYIDFPITKEEFYVLLVLVGTLNIFLFLKWCFPFKQGGDLK